MIHVFRARSGTYHGLEIEHAEELPRYLVQAACGALVARSGGTDARVDCEACCVALGLPIPELISDPVPWDGKPGMGDRFFREHNRTVSNIGEI